MKLYIVSERPLDGPSDGPAILRGRRRAETPVTLVRPIAYATHTQADGQTVETVVLRDGRVLRVAGPPDGVATCNPQSEIRKWLLWLES